MRAAVLVMAKAPVAGRVKTRLAATEGAARAAALARAALLDTLETSANVFPAGQRFLALDGRLGVVTGQSDGEATLPGWTVLPQRGHDFAARLGNAHADVHRDFGGPVVQIGMDTPHLTRLHLTTVADRAVTSGRPVLGRAEDGGWWVLVSTRPTDVVGLEHVPMSTAQTYEATRALLRHNAREVLPGPVVRDVDEAADARVAARSAPGSRFAAVWAAAPTVSEAAS